METISININVPSDIFKALDETEDEFKKELTLSVAIRLYQQNKLSLSKAANLAGYHQYDFEKILSADNIAISNLSINDILSDLNKM
jgi:predicted HTH domain antitoxin